MIFEFLGEIVGQAIGEILGYGTGQIVIPILSFGAARGERMNDERDSRPTSFFWRDGKGIVFSSGTTTFVGILFWGCMCVAGYFFSCGT